MATKKDETMKEFAGYTLAQIKEKWLTDPGIYTCCIDNLTLGALIDEIDERTKEVERLDFLLKSQTQVAGVGSIALHALKNARSSLAQAAIKYELHEQGSLRKAMSEANHAVETIELQTLNKPIACRDII